MSYWRWFKRMFALAFISGLCACATDKRVAGEYHRFYTTSGHEYAGYLKADPKLSLGEKVAKLRYLTTMDELACTITGDPHVPIQFEAVP